MYLPAWSLGLTRGSQASLVCLKESLHHLHFRHYRHYQPAPEACLHFSESLQLSWRPIAFQSGLHQELLTIAWPWVTLSRLATTLHKAYSRQELVAGWASKGWSGKRRRARLCLTVTPDQLLCSASQGIARRRCQQSGRVYGVKTR